MGTLPKFQEGDKKMQIIVKTKVFESQEGGGGGYSHFYSYVGSGPASAVLPKINIRNFKHPNKNIQNFSHPKNIPNPVP